jgi:hypothetical protein
MNIEYKWTISRMQAYANYDNKDNVVYQVYYALEGLNKDNNDIAHSTGDVIFGVIENPEFIDYENLTEDIVLQWVLNELGEEKINYHKKDIENKLNIKRIEVSLPWVKQENTEQENNE